MFHSIRDRWSYLPLIWRFLIVLVVIAGVGVFGWRPGYAAFRDWRVEKNLERAAAALETRQMVEARDLSLSVLQSGREDIEAFRILEQSMAAVGDPRHGRVARSLLTHPDGNEDDKWNGFRAMVDDVPLGLAAQAWAALREESQLTSRFAVRFGDRLIREAHWSEATVVLLGVPEAERSAAHQRGVIRLLIGSATVAGYDEAQVRIAARFAEDQDGREELLEMLEGIPFEFLRLGALEPVRVQLEKEIADETADAREQLMLERIRLTSHSTDSEALIAAAKEQWQKSAPLELARFLWHLGLVGDICELFSEEVVIADGELLRLVLQAMERTNAWLEMAVLLGGEGLPLPKEELSAYKAVAANGSGNAPERVRNWATAMSEAATSKSVDAYLRIEEIARRNQITSEADQALLAAIKTGDGPLPRFTDLEKLVERLETEGRENDLLEVYALYLPFEPNNAFLFCRYAYLACMTATLEPAALFETAERIAEKFPGQAQPLWTLAAVELCEGNAARAEEWVARAEATDPESAEQPKNRMLALLTQVASGRADADGAEVKDFAVKDLLPSERKRFGEIVQAARKTKD